MGQGSGLVLDQFSGAALAHQQGFGLETIDGGLDRALDQLGRIAAQVPGLEGGVGDRGRRLRRSIIVNSRSA